MANHERLLPQQRLAQLLLPPVVHLGGEVVGISAEELVPTPLQQNAVLKHRREGVFRGSRSSRSRSLLGVVLTLGLLQFETILRSFLFRSSILGMLNLKLKIEKTHKLKKEDQILQEKKLAKKRGRSSA